METILDIRSAEAKQHLNENWEKARYFKRVEFPETFVAIYEILYRNGFRLDHNLNMMRSETGCGFGFDSCLNKYETVLEFQLDWPYS